MLKRPVIKIIRNSHFSHHYSFRVMSLTRCWLLSLIRLKLTHIFSILNPFQRFLYKLEQYFWVYRFLCCWNHLFDCLLSARLSRPASTQSLTFIFCSGQYFVLLSRSNLYWEILWSRNESSITGLIWGSSLFWSGISNFLTWKLACSMVKSCSCAAFTPLSNFLMTRLLL